MLVVEDIMTKSTNVPVLMELTFLVQEPVFISAKVGGGCIGCYYLIWGFRGA